MLKLTVETLDWSWFLSITPPKYIRTAEEVTQVFHIEL